MKFCPNCASELSNQLLDGVQRLVCPQTGCGFVFWDNPVPVVAAVVEYNQQVVLARNARWPRGVFSMITGYLERGESPEQAVLREVQEELGLTGEIRQFIGHYPFVRKNQLILAFAVTASGEIRLNHEIAEVELIPKADLDPRRFAKLHITAKVFDDWLQVQRRP